MVARRSIIVGEVGTSEYDAVPPERREGGANVVGPRRRRTSRNVRKGLRVAIRGSKTDQEGAGAVVAACRGSIDCPVAAVRDWLAAAGKRRDSVHPVKAAAIARQALKLSDHAHKSELPLHKAPETDRRILQGSVTQNKLAA